MTSKRPTSAWLCVALLLAPCAALAQTQTNMAVVCTEDKNLANQPISACSYNAQRFVQVVDSSWVRWCRVSSCVQSGNPDTQSVALWQRFDAVAEGEYVEVCTAPKAPGDPIVNGSCRAKPEDGAWSAMRWVVRASVNRVPTLPPAQFTATPASGYSPLKVTVAWNVPGLAGATPCTGTGHPSWAGAKTAIGSEIYDLYADAAFTLTCANVDSRNVLLSWKPPTHNTDGTVLTGIDSYRLSYGAGFVDQRPVLSESVLVPGAAQHFILENLAPATWNFGMQTNAGSVNPVSGPLSNIVTYTTRPPTAAPPSAFSGTVRVAVTTTPEPPSDLNVVEPTAYQLEQSPDQLTVREFGYVPLGTPCDPQQAAMGLYLIKRATTTPNEGEEVPPVALAKCEKGTWQRDLDGLLKPP